MQPNELITYYPSPVGVLKIKSDGQSISEILFCEEGVPPVVADKPDAATRACLQQLTEYFKGKRKEFDFPMSQDGTAFQQKVWAALSQISYGEKISYLELSKRIGNTKAIRACGTANGQNQIAIVVPCHRVIGADGKLVGYAGGLWRKKWLLLHEAQFTTQTNTLF